jgi:hypothetical protein
VGGFREDAQPAPGLPEFASLGAWVCDPRTPDFAVPLEYNLMVVARSE